MTIVIRNLLVANRGEIAVRVMRTARRMGIRTVAVYSDADRDALHVASADEAFRIGPPPVADSYLRADAILAAARTAGADAIHPGYGFLSENPDFADAVEAAGLVFVGPPADAMRAMGLKDAAKARMIEAGVPVVPGYHGADQDPGRLAEEAARVGYPVLIKAAAGGGGKGMRRVDAPRDFAEALSAAQREARSAFGVDRVLIERYVAKPRHIEVQVFADNHGRTLHFHERDCSLQRRHQKVVEEAPAPGMTAALRRQVGAFAVRAAEAVGYRGAGTVEFITDATGELRADRFFFMEMNTRLQVEHPVTEMVTGLDLVEWQLRVARGESLPFRQEDLVPIGHAVEARLYAEDPARGFLPQTGRLRTLALATGPDLRVDTGVREGDAVTPFYDPMIAKVIAWGDTRAEAMSRLAAGLRNSHVGGCTTNLEFLVRLLGHPDVDGGDVDTGLIDRELDALVRPPDTSQLVQAVAAVAAAGLLDGAAGQGPFASLRAFRLWGDAESWVVLEGPGGPARFSVSEGRDPRFRVVGPDGAETAFDVERVVLPALRVIADGRASDFTVHRDGLDLAVGAADGVHRFRQADAAASEAPDAAGGDGGTVRAAMPGLVTAVRVAAGTVVRAGDPLVVTEAMKMEHTAVAPRDGCVRSVDVSIGDQVREGATLVTLEDHDG